MNSDQMKALREQLRQAMRGDQSHIDFESATSDLTAELAGKKPNGAPHSIWELLEHMRIAQHDILEFSRDPAHKSPKWPDGYWPKTAAPPSQHAWEVNLAALKTQAQEMEELVANGDLFQTIAGGTGQTLLREALVVAAHNSYHLGQLVYLKKMLLAK